MMFVLFAITIPMAIQTNDVDPSVFIHTEVFRGIELLERQSMQPLHGFSAGLWVKRLKFRFQFSRRQFLDRERVPFPEMLACWLFGRRHG